jgi:hypothetical protein
MLSADVKRRLDIGLTSVAAATDLEALLTPVGLTGTTWYVDTYHGSNSGDGRSWRSPFLTMAYALSQVATGDTVLFRGKVQEECVGSNLVFDVTIMGALSLHHADQPGSGSALYDYGAASWVPPSSSAGPLLKVRGRGWKFVNVLFDAPSAYAAVRLERNASSGTDEYDASHASFIGCDFRSGLYGIHDYDGCWNVTVRDCVFETFDASASAAAIISTTNVGVAAPRRWRILNNLFQAESTTNGNERHLVMGLAGSWIKGNAFGTVHGTGLYVDLTGGSGNIVTQNYLQGNYDTTDYKAGTGDGWVGNFSLNPSGKATVTAGRTTAVPGA